jgi:hypothetical protein
VYAKGLVGLMPDVIVTGSTVSLAAGDLPVQAPVNYKWHGNPG